MSRPYTQGIEARVIEKAYGDNPFSRKTRQFYLWCAGWNDEDMRLKNMRYFVNDATRLVRTDDTGHYEPTGDWREVTLAEWNTFRLETKAQKGKRK